ncbi:aryl hydrocarbon receptor 2 [Trichomycterus rosablanca]|uniref:aryl hydrocarbon receptor 2 n=1 Tax=Trichomycterus rosablanca TaxID=2290929 RepID=UPI002F355EE9
MTACESGGGGGGGGGTYASKKRKKPVQKIPKPPPPDGAKSNPSKRHRDRLNMELDKLTNLLPFSEDVRTRLDKLSVLRLSVGYLKVKSFFIATMKKSVNTSNSWTAGTMARNGQTLSSLDGVNISEGELLLQALNGFVMVVTADGYVFYASPTIQDYLGFHQSDVVHQSVFELIHTDDRDMFRRQLHFALNPTQCELSDDTDILQKTSDITSAIINYNPQQLPPENSSFLERSFCCRFRCLLDNSSGFLGMNFQGRLKYLHGQSKKAEDGTMNHPQLALFVVATPLQPPSILEIRSKTLLFQTKHKLDFTPMGVDTRGKVVLGYNEIELCMRGSGYQFIHAADMMYCADNHLRMIKTGESGFTVFRLLSKAGIWIWVQANARLVYKGGRPDFIIARQRALTNEEGEEHLRQRKLQLPFSFATGEAVLYETTPSPNVTDIPSQIKEGKISKPAALPPSSLLTCMLKQDQSIYQGNSDQFCLEKAFRDSHALLNVPGKSWAGAEGNSVGIKKESPVQAMMDSLQQIIGDTSLCGKLDELDVDELELKEWENTLLRMNNLSNAKTPFENDEIMTEDIFSYLEDVLFKESSTSLNECLPECLSEMQLQGDLNETLGIQDGIRTDSSGRGMIKHAHLGPEIPFGQPGDLEEPYVSPMELCENMTPFNPLLHGQQNQAGLVQQRAPAQHVQAGFVQRAQTRNLLDHQNQVQPTGFHNQSSLPFSQAIREGSQWTGTQTPNSKNTSPLQNVMLKPASNACLQGQFILSNQNIDNQRLMTMHQTQPSIQQGLNSLPQVPNIPNVPNLPNSHHHIICGQSNDLQQDPVSRLMVQSNYVSGTHPQPVATAYGQQGELMQPSNAVYGQQGGSSQPANAAYGQQGGPLQPSNALYGQQAGASQPANAVYGQHGGSVQPANAVYGQHGGSVQPANAVYGQQGGSVQPANAVYGQQGGSVQPAYAVYEQQRGSSQPSNAVYGQQGGSSQPSNTVYGQQGGSSQPSNTVYGQQGGSSQPSNTVYGQQGGSSQPSNAVYGQQGRSSQPSNAVYGQQGGSSQPSNAVYGQQGRSSQPNKAVYGQQGGSSQPSNVVYGQQGRSSQPNKAVYGQQGGSSQPSNVVYGQQGGSSQPSNAVYGQPGGSSQPSNAVYGQQGGSSQPSNTVYGQQGGSSQPSNAVYGQQGGSSQPNKAVYGQQGGSSQPNKAVYGQQGGSSQPNKAVYGQQGGSSQFTNAVYGHQEISHPSNAIHNQQERLRQTSNAVYDQQGKLMGNCAAAPISSCMFGKGNQTPVNSLPYSSTGQDAVISVCQKPNGFLAQNSTQGLCLYQSGPAEGVINDMALSPDGNIICNLPQQFLTCNSQTKITNRPVKENKPFHFAPLNNPNENF